MAPSTVDWALLHEQLRKCLKPPFNPGVRTKTEANGFLEFEAIMIYIESFRQSWWIRQNKTKSKTKKKGKFLTWPRVSLMKVILQLMSLSQVTLGLSQAGAHCDSLQSLRKWVQGRPWLSSKFRARLPETLSFRKKRKPPCIITESMVKSKEDNEIPICLNPSSLTFNMFAAFSSNSNLYLCCTRVSSPTFLRHIIQYSS